MEEWRFRLTSLAKQFKSLNRGTILLTLVKLFIFAKVVDQYDHQKPNPLSVVQVRRITPDRY